MGAIGNRRANARFLALGGTPPEPTAKDLESHFFSASFGEVQDKARCNDKEMLKFITRKYKGKVFMRENDRRDFEREQLQRQTQVGQYQNQQQAVQKNGSSINPNSPISLEPDDHITFSGQLKLLAGMGFTDVTKCLVALKRGKGNIDAAVGLLVHGKNLDPAPQQSLVSKSLPVFSSNNTSMKQSLEHALAFLYGMGFTDRDTNIAALKKADANVDCAVSILMDQAYLNFAPKSVAVVENEDLMSLNNLMPMTQPASLRFQNNQQSSASPFNVFSSQSQPIQADQQQLIQGVQQSQVLPFDKAQLQQLQHQQPTLQKFPPFNTTQQLQPYQQSSLQQFQRFYALAQQVKLSLQQQQFSSVQQAWPPQPSQVQSQQQNTFISSAEQIQLKPNYSPQISPGLYSTHSPIFQPQSQQRQQQTLNFSGDSAQQIDPFAALLKDSNMMPAQQMPAQQFQGFGLQQLQHQQQLTLGMTATKNPVIDNSNYSATPAFAVFNQQQIPRVNGNYGQQLPQSIENSQRNQIEIIDQQRQLLGNFQ
ncbi:hypothetical protein HK100_002258, partial [Physocladia obscura]